MELKKHNFLENSYQKNINKAISEQGFTICNSVKN